MDTTAGLTAHVDTAKCVATTPIPSGILPTDGMPHLGRPEDTTDIEDCTLSELMHKNTVFSVHYPSNSDLYGICTNHLSMKLLSISLRKQGSTKASNFSNGGARMAAMCSKHFDAIYMF